jgi:hypothetical protein
VTPDQGATPQGALPGRHEASRVRVAELLQWARMLCFKDSSRAAAHREGTAQPAQSINRASASGVLLPELSGTQYSDGPVTGAHHLPAHLLPKTHLEHPKCTAHRCCHCLRLGLPQLEIPCQWRSMPGVCPAPGPHPSSSAQVAGGHTCVSCPSHPAAPVRSVWPRRLALSRSGCYLPGTCVCAQ